MGKVVRQRWAWWLWRWHWRRWWHWRLRRRRKATTLNVARGAVAFPMAVLAIVRPRTIAAIGKSEECEEEEHIETAGTAVCIINWCAALQASIGSTHSRAVSTDAEECVGLHSHAPVALCGVRLLPLGSPHLKARGCSDGRLGVQRWALFVVETRNRK